METATIQQPKTSSKAALWTGRIISGLCILFLLFDAIMKIIRESHSVEGTTQLGFSDSAVIPIGVVLLICTILYIIPRTAVIGAIFLTAYLGGATAIMVQAKLPIYFSITFGVLVWLGLYLRDARVRTLVLGSEK